MTKPRFLEPEEVQALLEAPNVKSLTGLRNRCLMGLMVECGLRISEALALKPRDVNIREKRVEVLRGKGGSPRTLCWKSSSLSELLERWKASRPDGDHLFTTIRGDGRGGPVSVRSFEKTIKHYATRAGISVNVTPHVLRHTFATSLLRNGTNLRIVQTALGHKNLSTTAVYTHVTDCDVREALRGY
jgi:integrase/recombinase XerD